MCSSDLIAQILHISSLLSGTRRRWKQSLRHDNWNGPNSHGPIQPLNRTKQLTILDYGSWAACTRDPPVGRYARHQLTVPMRDPLGPITHPRQPYLFRKRPRSRARALPPDITVVSLPLFFPFFLGAHLLLPLLRQRSAAAAASDVQLRFWLPEVMATLWRSPDD